MGSLTDALLRAFGMDTSTQILAPVRFPKMDENGQRKNDTVLLDRPCSERILSLRVVTTDYLCHVWVSGALIGGAVGCISAIFAIA